MVHGLSQAPAAVHVDGGAIETDWDGRVARVAGAVGDGFEILR